MIPKKTLNGYSNFFPHAMLTCHNIFADPVRVTQLVNLGSANSSSVIVVPSAAHALATAFALVT